jgi:hypothetical protein
LGSGRHRRGRDAHLVERDLEAAGVEVDDDAFDQEVQDLALLLRHERAPERAEAVEEARDALNRRCAPVRARRWSSNSRSWMRKWSISVSICPKPIRERLPTANLTARRDLLHLCDDRVLDIHLQASGRTASQSE